VVASYYIFDEVAPSPEPRSKAITCTPLPRFSLALKAHNLFLLPAWMCGDPSPDCSYLCGPRPNSTLVASVAWQTITPYPGAVADDIVTRKLACRLRAEKLAAFWAGAFGSWLSTLGSGREPDKPSHAAYSSGDAYLIPNVIPTALQRRLKASFFLQRLNSTVSSLSDRSHSAPLNERDRQGQVGRVPKPLPVSRRAKLILVPAAVAAAENVRGGLAQARPSGFFAAPCTLQKAT
jgi:hypothetical protein